MANLPAIPPTPAGLPPALQQQLNALALSMNVLNGVTGNGSGAATTLAMLSNAGLIKLDPTTGNYIAPGALDYAIPPAPTGLVASGALGNVILTWDNPAYSNHSYTEIWREQVTFTEGVADPSIIGNAVKIGTSAGIVGVYVDATGAASDCWYWVKFVSTANVTGAFNAIAGVRGTTSASPAYLMSLLNGAITSSELAASLATPISLITAPSTTAGSVAAQVLAETNARAAAITAEAATRAAAITAEAAARGTAITAEATTRAGAVDNLAQSISLLTAGVAGGFDPGAMWYFDTTTESWTGTAGTVAWNAGWIDFTATGASPRLTSPVIAVVGSQYATIRARVKRLAGAGWVGSAHYATSGHGFTETEVKVIADPVMAVGDIAVLEWDMAALTAGGTDWVANTITQIGLDLGATSADVFSFDWIAVGRNAPGASMAGLMTEQTARTSGDTANAASITTLSTQVNHATTGLPAAHSAISSEATARADAVSAVSGQVTALTTTVAGNQTSNTAAITTEQTARAAADTANANSISTLSAQVNHATTGLPAAHASVVSEANTRATGDAVNANAITALSVQVNDGATGLPAAHAAITTEASARATADTALSSSISTLSAQVNNVTTGLPAAMAAIQTEATARANADAAIASSISTLQTTVGGHTASISTHSTSINGLSASYTMKIDNNGVMSGFGVASSLIAGDLPTSQFLVNVDQFAIIAPGRTAGTLASVPFAVLTTAQTINGVAFSPGVYFDGGSIVNGTITGNAIAAGTIAADKIAAGTITAASGLIANAAITTANIQDAAITTAKIGLAQITTALIGSAQITQALIANAAIGAAQIQDAVITNAKIGDAQVNTLKLAGQAVTIPVSASSSTPAAVGQNISCAIVSTGAPIAIVASVSMWISASGAGPGNSLFVDVNRDGITIGSSIVLVSNQVLPVYGTGTVVITDTPGIGAHTYTVVTRKTGTGTGTGQFLSGGINLMETKR